MVTKGRLRLTVLPQHWFGVRPFDCEDASEPCPVAPLAEGVHGPEIVCRFYIDNPAHPEVTCAVDVADEGPMLLTQVAEIEGVRWQMVQKIERRAVRKLRRKGLAAPV